MLCRNICIFSHNKCVGVFPAHCFCIVFVSVTKNQNEIFVFADFSLKLYKLSCEEK
jgi:hypothetical protein